MIRKHTSTLALKPLSDIHIEIDTELFWNAEYRERSPRSVEYAVWNARSASGSLKIFLRLDITLLRLLVPGHSEES